MAKCVEMPEKTGVCTFDVFRERGFTHGLPGPVPGVLTMLFQATLLPRRLSSAKGGGTYLSRPSLILPALNTGFQGSVRSF